MRIAVVGLGKAGLPLAAVIADSGFEVIGVDIDDRKIGKPLNEIKICIKGITFREGVKELYHSRNLALAKLLMEKGLDVFVYDDLYSREEVGEMGLRYLEPEDADLVFDCFRLTLKTRKGE